MCSTSPMSYICRQKSINFYKTPQRNFGKHISHRLLKKEKKIFAFDFFLIDANSDKRLSSNISELEIAKLDEARILDNMLN